MDTRAVLRKSLLPPLRCVCVSRLRGILGRRFTMCLESTSSANRDQATMDRLVGRRQEDPVGRDVAVEGVLSRPSISSCTARSRMVSLSSWQRLGDFGNNIGFIVEIIMVGNSKPWLSAWGKGQERSIERSKFDPSQISRTIFRPGAHRVGPKLLPRNDQGIYFHFIIRLTNSEDTVAQYVIIVYLSVEDDGSLFDGGRIIT